jgi:hypothetical protein
METLTCSAAMDWLFCMVTFYKLPKRASCAQMRNTQCIPRSNAGVVHDVELLVRHHVDSLQEHH